MKLNNNNIKNVQTLEIKELDNIPRCPECNLISSLKLYYKEGKPIIKLFL